MGIAKRCNTYAVDILRVIDLIVALGQTVAELFHCTLAEPVL